MHLHPFSRRNKLFILAFPHYVKPYLGSLSLSCYIFLQFICLGHVQLLFMSNCKWHYGCQFSNEDQMSTIGSLGGSQQHFFANCTAIIMSFPQFLLVEDDNLMLCLSLLLLLYVSLLLFYVYLYFYFYMSLYSVTAFPHESFPFICFS